MEHKQPNKTFGKLFYKFYDALGGTLRENQITQNIWVTLRDTLIGLNDDTLKRIKVAAALISLRKHKDTKDKKSTLNKFVKKNVKVEGESKEVLVNIELKYANLTFPMIILSDENNSREHFDQIIAGQRNEILNILMANSLDDTVKDNLQKLIKENYAATINALIAIHGAGAVQGFITSGSELKAKNEEVYGLSENIKILQIPNKEGTVLFDCFENPELYLRNKLRSNLSKANNAQAVFDVMYYLSRPKDENRPEDKDYNTKLFQTVFNEIKNSNLTPDEKGALAVVAGLTMKSLAMEKGDDGKDLYDFDGMQNIKINGKDVLLWNIINEEKIVPVFEKAGVFKGKSNVKAMVIAGVASFSVFALALGIPTVLTIIDKELDFGIVNSLSQFIKEHVAQDMQASLQEAIRNPAVQIGTVLAIAAILAAVFVGITAAVTPKIPDAVVEEVVNMVNKDFPIVAEKGMGGELS